MTIEKIESAICALKQCVFCITVNCYKISNTFPFLSSNKIMVISAVFYKKMLSRIANSEDPDQTAFEEAV